ncbi:MAG: type II toxin-antitoxin system HicA family toxin [Chloroflexi bacterium]|nr:type II toxin-antitoxin system HicA family toxin [Chloroflexota bacterium]
MASREAKAISRLRDARGALPYLDVSRALRALGWVEAKGRGSHKLWIKAGSDPLGFPVRHPGGYVLPFYWPRIRRRVGLEVSEDE